MDLNPYAAPTVDPSASRTQSSGNGPRDWTTGEAIAVGWSAVKATPLQLIGGFALSILINQGLQNTLRRVLGIGQGSSGNIFANFASEVSFLPIAAVLGIYFTIGQFRVAIAAARGEEFIFGRFFSGFDRLLPGILAALITYVGVGLGLLFLIVPGIILALGWSMVLPLLADSEEGIGGVLSESWAATKGQRTQIGIFYLACAAVALVGLLAFVIGILVAIPVIMVAMAEVYMCVTGRRNAEA